MSTKQIFILSILGIWMAGCASVKVSNMANINFNTYRKFTFVQPEVAGQQSNPLLKSGITEQNIQQAITDALAIKHIVRDDQNPDFFVMYHEYFEKEVKAVPNNTSPYNGFGYGGWGFGPARFGFRGAFFPIYYGSYYNPWNTGMHNEQFLDGALVIDVIDAKNNQLIWRGSIENPVNNVANLGKQFAREAKKILDKYPVQ